MHGETRPSLLQYVYCPAPNVAAAPSRGRHVIPDTNNAPALPGFSALALDANVVRALTEVGYETLPIQAATIPALLEGRDVIGQAQTGTGKTAAFALPVLSRIDLRAGNKPQALVLAPTRELAIQVAEAFRSTPPTCPASRCCRSTAGRATVRSCRA